MQVKLRQNDVTSGPFSASAAASHHAASVAHAWIVAKVATCLGD